MATRRLPSTQSDGVAVLLGLIDAITPKVITVAGPTHEPTEVTNNARRNVPDNIIFNVDVETPSRMYSSLQSCLVEFAGRLEGLDLTGLRTYLLNHTLHTNEDAEEQIASGEPGLQGHQQVSLFFPVNRILRLAVQPGQSLYWRTVGLGKAGKPDYELAFISGGQELILAVVELKTTKTVTSNDLNRIRGAIDYPGIYWDSTSNERTCLQSQVSGGFESFSPLEQLTTELYSKDVNFGILENDEIFLLVHRQEVDGQSIITAAPNTIASTGVAVPRSLWQSPAGLLVGVALQAMKEKLPSYSSDNLGASDMGRTSTETVRPTDGTGSAHRGPGSQASTSVAPSQTARPGVASHPSRSATASNHSFAPANETTRTTTECASDPTTSQIEKVADASILQHSRPQDDCAPGRPMSQHHSDDHHSSSTLTDERSPAVATDKPLKRSLESDSDPLPKSKQQIPPPIKVISSVHVVPAALSPVEIPVNEIGNKRMSLGCDARLLSDVFMPLDHGIICYGPSMQVNSLLDSSSNDYLPRLLSPSTTSEEVIFDESYFIGQFKQRGALWQVYNLLNGSTDDPDLDHDLDHVGLSNGSESVCKIAMPHTFNDPDSTRNFLTVKQAIRKEDLAITGPLLHLQGRTILRYKGLWASVIDNQEIWVAIHENGGEHLPVEYARNEIVRMRILALYNDIHQAGVIHGDVAWRHILAKNKNLATLRLIDFDHCIIRAEDDNDQNWDQQCATEISEVRRMMSSFN